MLRILGCIKEVVLYFKLNVNIDISRPFCVIKNKTKK